MQLEAILRQNHGFLVALAALFVMIGLAGGAHARYSAANLIGVWPVGLAEPQPGHHGAPPSPVGGIGHAPFIIRGSESSNRFVVGIFFHDDEGRPSICSGLYISTFYVLTAKHCTCHTNGYLVTNDVDMLSNSASWQVAALAGSRLGAPCNSISDLNLAEGNDLALLKLASPLPMGPHGECTRFNMTDQIMIEGNWLTTPLKVVRVSGFGRDPASVGSQEMRREGRITVNSLTCKNAVAAQLGCVEVREFIAGARQSAPTAVDSCGGDSGGPVFVADAQGAMTPIGAVSRALPGQPSSSCGGGGIYTHYGRTDVLAWLRSLMIQADGCS